MQSIHNMYRYRHTFSNLKSDTYLNQDILHIWDLSIYLLIFQYIYIYIWLQVYHIHTYLYIHIERLKFSFEAGYRPQKVLTWSFWSDWTWGKGAPVATSPHDPWASSHWGLRPFGVCIWSMCFFKWSWNVCSHIEVQKDQQEWQDVTSFEDICSRGSNKQVDMRKNYSLFHSMILFTRFP